jgi:hypothetical protein
MTKSRRDRQIEGLQSIITYLVKENTRLELALAQKLSQEYRLKGERDRIRFIVLKNMLEKSLDKRGENF